jgi:acyl-coenzyme A thioesterase PaaI-like protein
MLQMEPFLTDEDLAQRLGVSIATIRLDRMELGVPEMRERARHLAEKVTTSPVSMQANELVGLLLTLELGSTAISTLEIAPEMCFARTGIARGHHLFAQANSLAVAVIKAPVTLTAVARVRFLRPVHMGERVTAKAGVGATHGQRSLVRVISTVEGKPVLDGKFVVVSATPIGEGRDQA